MSVQVSITMILVLANVPKELNVFLKKSIGPIIPSVDVNVLILSMQTVALKYSTSGRIPVLVNARR